MLAPILLASLVLAADTPPSPARNAATTRPTTRPAWVPADPSWSVREGLVLAVVEQVPADRAWQATQGRTREPTRVELKEYEVERSEATLQALRDIGVTLVLVPYGGFGPDDAEIGERRTARETVERCHRLGLKCGVWLPVGQVDPGAWVGNDVRPDAWLIRNTRGQPLPAGFPGRSFTSLGVPAVRERLERLAREAVEQAGADAVFLPDWRAALGYESEGRDWLRSCIERDRSLSERARRELLERLNRDGPPIDVASPLMPAWISARVAALALGPEALERARRGRDVLIGIDSVNPARQIGLPDGAAVDPPSLLAPGRLTALRGLPGVGDRGQITHQVVEMKTARACEARVVSMRLTKMSLAQQLAFGGDCGGVMAYFIDGRMSADAARSAPLQVELVSAVQEYRRRRELYAEMEPVADIRFFLPPRARLAVDSNVIVAQSQAAHAMVTHRIPFSFVFDERLPPLPRDSAVVVAGVPELTEDQAGDLRAHVVRGGGALIIGNTRVVDDSGRTAASDLARYIADNAPQRAANGLPPSDSRIRAAGDGRVVALERLLPEIEVWMTTRRHSRARKAAPLESDELAVAIRAALGRPLSVEGRFDRGAALELTRSHDGRRTALHIVNYDPRSPLAETEIQVRVPFPGAVSRVRRFPGMGGNPENVTFERAGDIIIFAVGSIALYDAYLLD